ncbi:hypothetical protein PR001_g23332 [Phytophthora rubi]|nr:hypothetical protein PR001_g23332 [Phytophthora rubi]
MDLATGTTVEELDLAHFSNPQGVWNKFTSTWDIPVGRQWNGRYWAKKSVKRDRPARATEPLAVRRMVPAKADQKAKASMAVAADQYEEEESDNDAETTVSHTPAPAKKRKSAERGTKAATRLVKPGETATDEKPASQRLGVQCYACHHFGHIAAKCPDDDARTRNEEYLKRRHEQNPQGNEERAA